MGSASNVMHGAYPLKYLFYAQGLSRQYEQCNVLLSCLSGAYFQCLSQQIKGKLWMPFLCIMAEFVPGRLFYLRSQHVVTILLWHDFGDVASKRRRFTGAD